MSPVSGCACCLSAVEAGPRGVAYCSRCARHQRLYMVGIVLLVGASWRLSPEVVDFVFAQLPFASVWLHATLVFVLGMIPMLGAVGIVSILSAGATHGHWGSAILQRSDSVLFRNATYGRQLATQLGRTCHKMKEPRLGWMALLLLCIVMPGVFASLSRLGPKEGFKRALLTHLRSVGGPEVIVYIDAPTREGEGPWSVHFGSERSYSSAFSSSATKAASRVFQHELMEFKSADDVDSSKQTKLEVHVQWQVGASEVFFDSLLAFGRLPGEGSTIQGIDVVAQFRFRIPGHAEPFLFHASAAPTRFESSSFVGLPSVSGLYAGMLDSAFESLMEQVLLQ